MRYKATRCSIIICSEFVRLINLHVSSNDSILIKHFESPLVMKFNDRFHRNIINLRECNPALAHTCVRRTFYTINHYSRAYICDELSDAL